MKNIQEDTRLVEEISESNESKTNNSDINKKEITLIFRNPSSKDTTLNIDLTSNNSFQNIKNQKINKNSLFVLKLQAVFSSTTEENCDIME